jgi:hypothetical protein
MNTQERIAIDAVATQFSATWKAGRDRGAVITVGGKRVAVEIANLNPRAAGQGHTREPRLRFDKVATRLVERLQATVGPTLSEGTTMLLTITAPIRLAAKTAAALEEKIHARVGRRSLGRDESATVHGNRVRIRFVRTEPGRAPTLIAFVHNADSDPLLLLNMTGGLLDQILGVRGRAPKAPGDRWLVLMSGGGRSRLEAYRYIYSQLGVVTGFNKVVIVFGDGWVETLSG